MASLKLDIGGDILDAFQDFLNDIDNVINPALVQAVDDLLDEYEDGRSWTGTADGIPITTRAGYANATRNVRILFDDDAINLVVRQLVSIMRNTMRTAAAGAGIGAEGKWTNQRELVENIEMYYIPDGDTVARPYTGSEIKNFTGNAVLFIVPTYMTQMYANASKFGATGYMRKTSAAIRRKLGVNKQTSPVRVTAERSRATFQAILRSRGFMRRPDGSDIVLTFPWPNSDSSWVIAVRPKNKGRT